VARAFTDLYFNMEEETFEFYGPVKMRDNPHWISVTQLLQEGLDPFITLINTSTRTDIIWRQEVR